MNVVLKLSNIIIAGSLATLPISASGHHSMSEFDRSVDAVIEGTVSRVSWRNPRVLLEVTTTDDSGAEAVWNLEGSAVSAQRRRGLTDGLIELGDVADAADIPLSHLGYSVGHWEGETLVVSTSRVSWPYFDRVGVPQTENVAIHERFTAVENGNRLQYLLTVTEPASLVEPFVWDAYFVWKRGEEVNRYECTLEE